MAAEQPEEKDVTILKAGTSRALIIAEFGPPLISEMKDGKKHEIFKFRQGYSTATRTARAVGHSVAGAVTLGMWDVVGTPTEGAFRGKDMAYEVVYDPTDRVETVMVLKE